MSLVVSTFQIPENIKSFLTTIVSLLLTDCWGVMYQPFVNYNKRHPLITCDACAGSIVTSDTKRFRYT